MKGAAFLRGSSSPLYSARSFLSCSPHSRVSTAPVSVCRVRVCVCMRGCVWAGVLTKKTYWQEPWSHRSCWLTRPCPVSLSTAAANSSTASVNGGTASIDGSTAPTNSSTAPVNDSKLLPFSAASPPRMSATDLPDVAVEFLHSAMLLRSLRTVQY
eukprot:2456493-Rhodomonas_salina.2